MHVKSFYPSSKQVGELEINFITQFNLKVRTQGLLCVLKDYQVGETLATVNDLINACNFRGPIRGILRREKLLLS